MVNICEQEQVQIYCTRVTTRAVT